MRVEVDLSRAAALHLVHALRRWREYCEEHDYYPQSDLEKLARTADEIAKGTRTEADSPRSDGETGTNGYLPNRPFFSRREVADLTGKNERTIRRWIADGKLECADLGVPRSELVRLTAARREEPQSC